MDQHKKIISILVALTGFVHLGIGIITTMQEASFLNISLVLNGIGYFSLLAALYYLPQFQDYEKILRMALIAFTGITILAYIAIFVPQDGLAAFLNPVGAITKIVELVIVILEFRYLQANPEQ